MDLVVVARRAEDGRRRGDKVVGSGCDRLGFRKVRRNSNFFLVKGPIENCKIFDNLRWAGGWSRGEVAVSCPVCCWVVHLVG